MNKPRITWTCFMHPYTAMGVIAINVVKELIELSYDVGINALNNDVNPADYPLEVRQALSVGLREDSINIFFSYPDIYGNVRCRVNVGYTGADSTEWYKTSAPPPAETCNKFMNYMLTPSKYSSDIMYNCGVKVPIYVFPHGVDLDKFYHEQREYSEPFTFLYVGELSRRKGVQDLIETFLGEYSNDKTAQLIMRANTHMKDYDGKAIEEECKKYENIKIIYEDKGHDSLVNLYHESHVYVYPSRADWFGMTPFEALATGLPTIASATNGYYDYLKGSVIPISFSEEEIKDQHPYLKGKWFPVNKFHLQAEMAIVRNLYAAYVEFFEVNGAFSEVRNNFSWKNVTKTYLVPFIDDIYNKHFKDKPMIEKKEEKKDPTRVTIGIPTKDRLVELTILLQSLLEQTYTNFDIILIDDWKRLDNPTFNALVKLLESSGHKVTIIKGERRGPHIAGQKILDNAETEFILRLDDDVTIRPTCIEELVKVISSDEKIGAVGLILLNPHEDISKQFLPKMSEEEITRIGKVFWEGDNLHLYGALQLYIHSDDKPKEVEHMYSGFMYRKSAGIKAGGYPKDLSVVGHREETDFTYRIFRAGYKEFVVPTARGFHFHPMSGGIRETDGKMLEKENWDRDEETFMRKMNEWIPKDQKKEVKELITVGILTHGEEHENLKGLLKQIYQYTTHPFHVVIINNDNSSGSKDDLFELVHTQPYKDKQNLNVVCIPETSVSEARNMIYEWMKPESKYLCFIDDDAKILGRFSKDEDWLDFLKRKFNEEPDVGAVSPIHTWFDNLKCYSISVACMFTSKKVWEVVGGFDPVFGDLKKGTWGYEDVDWSYRCQKLGFKLKWVETNYFPFYHGDTTPKTKESGLDKIIEKTKVLLLDKYKDVDFDKFCRTNYPFTPEQMDVKGIKLNIGCNYMYLNGWINIDIKTDCGADQVLDVRDIKSMYKDKSVSMVLMSHCLEHINPKEADKAVKDIYDILVDGGCFIVEVPNCEDLDGRLSRGETNQKDYDICKYGTTSEFGQAHQSIFTPESLRKLLVKFGFKTIQNPNTGITIVYSMRFDSRKI